MAGTSANFVDTQGVSLTFNSIVYTQLMDVTMDIDSTVSKHQLTDDTINNVFSLRMNSVQGTMVLTTTEYAALVTATIDVSGVRPIHNCAVAWTDSSTATNTTTFQGQLKTLRPIDSGLGLVTLFFRIEAEEGVVVT